jgi:omega-amidase
MRIGLAPMDIRWKDKEANLAAAERLVGAAALSGCDILILPEMFNIGFCMDPAGLAEAPMERTAVKLRELAQRNGMALIAGYPTLAAADGSGKPRNTAAVFDRSGNALAEYNKIHPFSFLKEDRHFEAGTHAGTFRFEDMRGGLAICYDLRFPELFRSMATRVNCFIVIANWPRKRIRHWTALLMARAIENQAFVVGVNRSGMDGNNLEYDGCCHVFSPWGEEMPLEPVAGGILRAEIDLLETDRIRAEYPFLEDMKLALNPRVPRPVA